MAEFPALPLWTDAYLGDTTHLTTLEHGAYLLLLITMWRNKGRLPNDDGKLARYARLTPAQWRRVKPTLMEFFAVQDGQLTQGRLTDEYNAVKRHSARQSDKAKARWLKNNDTADAGDDSGTCRSDASPSLTLTHNSVPTERLGDAVDLFESDEPETPPPVAPDKHVYAYGREVLGKSAGGLVRKLIRHCDGDLGRAYAVLVDAQARDSPREYIGAVLNGSPNGMDWEAWRARHAARETG